jgi:hypothetical protein
MTTLVIDVDSHLTEPPDLWTSRVPARFVDRVPAMTRNEQGRDIWVLDGPLPGRTGDARAVPARRLRRHGPA